MTTYTSRSNAKRAAIKTGISEDQVEITVHKEKGEVRFGYKQKAAVPAATVPATVAAQPAPAPVAAAAPKAKKAAPKVEREERNGVKRPKEGGACATVWSWLDAHREATSADVKAQAEKAGWNANNASIEFYMWRKFNGIQRTVKAKKPRATKAKEVSAQQAT